MKKRLVVVLLAVMSFLAIGAGISACDCGGTPAERHGHEYIETVTEPTCTARGYTTFTCSCGKSYVGNYTDPLGHDFVGDVCSRCGYIRHAHDYEKTVVEPTCTEQGYTRGVCKICGAAYTADIKAPLGHKYIQTVTEPTCRERGYTLFTCECGYSYKDNYTEKIDHEYANGKCIYCDREKFTAGLKYTLSDDWAFYICSGIGTATDTEIFIADEYNGLPVRAIGRGAFIWENNITDVTIPDGITSIGESAFMGCDGLTSIIIPKSITSIEKNTFSSCDALTIYCEATDKPDGWDSKWNYCYGGSFDFVSSLVYCPVVWDCESNDVADDGNIYTVIGDIRYALKDGIATVVRQSYKLSGDKAILQTVSFKDNAYRVTSIGDFAFYTGDGLQSVTIPDGVISIGKGAFSNSFIKSLVVPDSVTTIGDSAFDTCLYLETITLGKGLTYIGQKAFMCCNKIKNIIIPDGVTSIKEETFYYCSSLNIVTLPQSVTSIKSYAFIYCRNLGNIIFKGTTEQWRNVEKGIGWNKGVGKITVQCSDGEIENDTELKYTLSNGGEYYICSGISAASGDGITDIIILNNYNNKPVSEIGERAFKDLKYVERIFIPDSVTTIKSYAFSGCDKLTELTIPDSVTTIENYAFYGCDNLKSITIPAGVTALESYTFASCPLLKSIIFKGTKAQWRAIPHTDWLYLNRCTIQCTDGDIVAGK